ncbi:Hypothetical predicted protein [Paramuricea clavata]|uniref:Uncharacterized protein n=1 Tax=Paramuricea clavata TaxID=317549 RepID=A0A6S7JAN8_PARCT|nr:Hypothetical predicted protein [Paramuricea clavata]
MQPLGKALKTAKIEGRPWKQELNRFLLQYRMTPQSTTSVPPAELLFNQTVQGKLPILHRKNIVNQHKEAHENENKRQKYNKRYANERRNAKESGIKEGDYVLVKQTKIPKPSKDDEDTSEETDDFSTENNNQRTPEETVQFNMNDRNNNNRDHGMNMYPRRSTRIIDGIHNDTSYSERVGRISKYCLESTQNKKAGHKPSRWSSQPHACISTRIWSSEMR